MVQSCKLYMDCEFSFTELEALSYFTHKVTLPMLNCVETSSQKDLLQVLLALHPDLADGKMHTFLQTPTSSGTRQRTSERNFISNVRECSKLQCGREYGFSDDSQLLTATQLDKLTQYELLVLPTNNLSTEKNFPKFSRLSEVAKFRDYRGQAKGIKNDMTPYKSKRGLFQNIAKQVKKVLPARETKWNAQQKMLMKARIEAKFENLNNQKNYSRKLLKNCKSWGGLCVSAEELEIILLAKSDNQDRIVNAKLAYFRQNHKPHMIARPDPSKHLLILKTSSRRLQDMS